jgi:nucleotide-binding universal stress UspA family protein
VRTRSSESSTSARNPTSRSRCSKPDHEDDLPGTLNELAVEYEAQLIVIGLRKRSAIGKFILGSQAQRILLEAEVPVLTAKA